MSHKWTQMNTNVVLGLGKRFAIRRDLLFLCLFVFICG